MSVTWCTGYIYLLGRLDWRGKSEVATNRKWARVRLERIDRPWEEGRVYTIAVQEGLLFFVGWLSPLFKFLKKWLPWFAEIEAWKQNVKSTYLFTEEVTALLTTARYSYIIASCGVLCINLALLYAVSTKFRQLRCGSYTECAFYVVPEHGSCIAQKACIGRDTPW